MIRFFSLYLLFLVLQGCAQQSVSLRPDVEQQSLVKGGFELCLDFMSGTSIDDKLLYLNAVNHFISEYNAQASYYKIHPCLLDEMRPLSMKKQQVTLQILNTRYIAPSEQFLYVVISGAGIYSLVNFGYGLAWASLSETAVAVELSDDIAGRQKTVYRRFTSWPYFHGLPEVKRRHMKQFNQFMFTIFKELMLSQQQPKLKVEMTR